MSNQWYIDADGRVDGPVTPRELRDRAAAGRLRPTDRVSPDGERWAPASKVKGLVFAPPAPPLPPPPAPPAAEPSWGTASPAAASQATRESAVLNLIAPSPEPLDEIPGYVVEGMLGAGGFGVVMKARHLKLNRVVALKTVRLDRASNAQMLARFEKEAMALARLQHPNVVAVYDFGHHLGRVYFAMELLDGEDLGNRIKRAGPMDERTAWLLARQTACGLAHAAGYGIVHRDVKPANLFLVPAPTGFGLPPGVPMVKVTDLGLARSADHGAADDRLTATGVILGTPVYMAPEQFRGAAADARTDIYALGATVYHAIAGRPPYVGDTVWDIMVQKMESNPRLGPPVSAETADLVAAMMTTDPDRRVGGYDELIARIDALPVMRGLPGTSTANLAVGPTTPDVRPPAAAPGSLADMPATAEMPTPTDADGPTVSALSARPNRRRTRLVVAAAAGFGLFGAGLAVLGGRDGPPPGDDAPPPVVVRYEAGGHQEELFDGKSVVGWIANGWGLDRDADGNGVLSGRGRARRPFPRLPDFRLLLGVDLHEATAAELTLAVGGPGDDPSRLVLRVSRDGGAVAGVRDGDRGPFAPESAAVAYPSAAELEGKAPYREWRVEWAGEVLKASFDGRPVVARPLKGMTPLNEVRLSVEGGPLRLERATLEGLMPVGEK